MLSTPQYSPRGWEEVTVPTTIVGALVRNKIYPDPFFGKSLRSIPGTTYPIGENFSNLPMPADSPFAVSWWYECPLWQGRNSGRLQHKVASDGLRRRACHVWLALDDAAGKRLTSNLYWLSTKPDLMGWPKVTYSETPALQYGDFAALNSLPKVRLEYSSKSERQGDKVRTSVTLKNPGKSLVFFVRLKANNAATAEEVLPVLWEDNYFSLLPSEERQVSATHSASDVGTAKLSVSVEGWNVELQQRQ